MNRNFAVTTPVTRTPVTFTALTGRSKNRLREHGQFEMSRRSASGLVLLHCANPSCKCDQDDTKTKWLGWFQIDVDINDFAVATDPVAR